MKPTVSDDKFTYVRNRICKNIRRCRVVTDRAIRRVLEGPPSSIRAEQAEVDRYNRTLLVPITREIVDDIMRLARQYDREICDIVTNDAVIAANPSPSGESCDIQVPVA